MAASTIGVKVPTYAIKCGGNTIVLAKVAEGAITPGDLVMSGTAAYQVLVNTGSATGVADLNEDAVADKENPMTHDFAAGDRCNVICNGMVRVIADAAGMTADEKAQEGGTTAYMVGDLDSTAVSAGDTYKTADYTAIIGGLRTCIGVNLTTAATTVAGVLLLNL